MPSVVHPGGQDVRQTLVEPAWIGLLAVLLVLVVQATYLGRLANCGVPERALGSISQAGGDHFSYLGAMENYIRTGEYYFLNQEGDTARAGRLPHYGIPYLFIRQFLDIPIASDVLALLQVALFAVAIWLSTGLVIELTEKRWAGWLFLLLVLMCPHLTPWMTILTPDGCGAALLAITMILFHRTLSTSARKPMLLSSITLTALITIKPYYALLVPVLACVWWWKDRGARSALRIGAILGAPLLLALAPWWIRNLNHFGRFFPFQQDLNAGYGFSVPDLAVRALLIQMGEDAVWWEPSSLSCRFKLDPPIPCTAPWPDYVSMDMSERLAKLQASFLDYQRESTEQNAAVVLNDVASAKEAYAAEHPWRSVLLNRFVLAGRFVANSGSYHLPISTANPCYSTVQFVPKALASLGYLLSLIGALYGIVAGFRAEWRVAVLALPAVYLLILFPGYIGLVEWRYFIGAYLSNLILFVILAARILDRRVSLTIRGIAPSAA